MSEYSAIFYGNVDVKSFLISDLLISRNIKHDFILYDEEYIFIISTVNKKKEFCGFDEILSYIDSYRYMYDFKEIVKWRY
jgi:hypothetical protein